MMNEHRASTTRGAGPSRRSIPKELDGVPRDLITHWGEWRIGAETGRRGPQFLVINQSCSMGTFQLEITTGEDPQYQSSTSSPCRSPECTECVRPPRPHNVQSTAPQCRDIPDVGGSGHGNLLSDPRNNAFYPPDSNFDPVTRYHELQAEYDLRSFPNVYSHLTPSATSNAPPSPMSYSPSLAGSNYSVTYYSPNVIPSAVPCVESNAASSPISYSASQASSSPNYDMAPSVNFLAVPQPTAQPRDTAGAWGGSMQYAGFPAPAAQGYSVTNFNHGPYAQQSPSSYDGMLQVPVTSNTNMYMQEHESVPDGWCF